jgi:hypothetical protein
LEREECDEVGKAWVSWAEGKQLARHKRWDILWRKEYLSRSGRERGSEWEGKKEGEGTIMERGQKGEGGRESDRGHTPDWEGAASDLPTTYASFHPSLSQLSFSIVQTSPLQTRIGFNNQVHTEEKYMYLYMNACLSVCTRWIQKPYIQSS